MFAQTIVRKVPSEDSSKERFCIMHELAVPYAHAFIYQCLCPTAEPDLTLDQVCDRLIAAGVSEPDVLRLIDEARADFNALPT